jgi:hypothetical protein
LVSTLGKNAPANPASRHNRLKSCPQGVCNAGFNALPPYHRVPVDIVVEIAGKVRPGHDRPAQQQRLERLECAVVDGLLSQTGKVSSWMMSQSLAGDITSPTNSIHVIGHSPCPVRGRCARKGCAWDRSPEATPMVASCHLIAEANYTFFSCQCIARGPGHRRERAVHHRQNPGMDVLLNLQQIHQSLVNHTVSPVALPANSPPKAFFIARR